MQTLRKIAWSAALLQGAWGMYTEKHLESVSMSDQAARLYNGIKQQDSWILRNGSSGSVVNLKQKNTDHDEWSFETEFSLPALRHPEFAGLYFWYTEEPVRHGPFKGASGKFNGVMAGLELVGKSLDIVISVNHGEMDYAGLRAVETELKDSPDPAIFKGHESLILKVISTAKNFKVEIYDTDKKLLYDRVRYTSMAEMGSRLSGKFFGLTTEYLEARPSVHFTLASMKLFQREESEAYSIGDYNAEVPEASPRLPHEVSHPDEEIQHAISGIEHLTKYIRVVMGEPQAKPVAENVTYIKKTLNFQSAHIIEIRDILKSLVTVEKKHAQEEDTHRQELFYLVEGIRKKLEEAPKPAERKVYEKRELPTLGLIVVGGVLFACGFAVGRKVPEARKMSKH
ncbi:uncharacterized protein NEMAJ01_0213 [Nematocida major]|uniref:uncharacterized protein n=1 Tax=Nematocida major TaxID=1912982 RepID=UPI00200769AA|nr:uncharacterized protein NEMAJ01_0213 [Nematocida major]KAH9385317.1 hypothetical protein NEMAJ01_0213 [Nematocida major]